MPIPLPLIRFLIRTGVAQRLPDVKRITGGGVNYLHYYSDAVLMAPNTEVAATQALFAAKGPHCIDLSLGAPQFAPAVDASPGPSSAAPFPTFSHSDYPPPLGLPELREAVAAKLARENGIRYAPDREVVITSGVCQAITLALDTFVNPGDAVVVLDPSFLVYHYALRWQRVRIRWVPTRVEGGRTVFDLRRLRRAMRGAKLILINTPSNPTGACLPAASLEAIVGLAARYDVLIFSDEVYERFVYDGRRHVSVASLPGARRRTITANSFSKSYAMAGHRVGYLSAHEFLMRPMTACQFIRAPFASTLSQELAQRALSQPAGDFVPVLEAFDARRRLAHAALAEMGLASELPAGAFYYWIDVSRWADSGMELCWRLLEQQKVLAMPGEAFGPSGRRYVRFSYAAEQPALREGLARLKRLLDAARGESTERRPWAFLRRPHWRRPSRGAETERATRR